MFSIARTNTSSAGSFVFSATISKASYMTRSAWALRPAWSSLLIRRETSTDL